MAENLGLGRGKLHACWMHSPEAPLVMVGLQDHGAEVPEMKWVAKLACTRLSAEGRGKASGLEQSWQKGRTCTPVHKGLTAYNRKTMQM